MLYLSIDVENIFELFTTMKRSLSQLAKSFFILISYYMLVPTKSKFTCRRFEFSSSPKKVIDLFSIKQRYRKPPQQRKIKHCLLGE